MAQLPTRSLRLRSYTTTDLDRLTGEKGEIFYDYEKRTLKVYNGAGVAASTVTVGPADRLVNGSRSLLLAANGALTISGDIRSEGDINIEINLADSTLQRWSFGEDGSLTFPDGTTQTTAWLGAGTPVYTSLIDSLDSSAITVTPSMIFSSDVTVENDLVAKNIVNGGQIWRFGVNGTLTAPGSVVAPNIFTNLIDSADSSAITVTPSAVFSSDVLVENDLAVKGLLTLSQGTISGPNTVTLAGAGVAAAGANQTYIKTSATNYQGVTNSNWTIIYVADPGLWVVAEGSDIAWFLSSNLKLWYENGEANPPATPPTGTISSINIENNGSQWRFEGEGSLILPSGVTVYSANNGANSVQTRIEAPSGDEIALISKGAWTYGIDGGERGGIDLSWYQNPLANDSRFATLQLNDANDNVAKVIIAAYNGTDNSDKQWKFDQTGVLTFPDGGTLRVGTVPAHSYGVAGDKAGTLAFDATYIYYCTADYVNNATNIWRRTPHAAGTW